jgi:hypothetical protein
VAMPPAKIATGREDIGGGKSENRKIGKLGLLNRRW